MLRVIFRKVFWRRVWEEAYPVAMKLLHGGRYRSVKTENSTTRFDSPEPETRDGDDMYDGKDEVSVIPVMMIHPI